MTALRDRFDAWWQAGGGGLCEGAQYDLAYMAFCGGLMAAEEVCERLLFALDNAGNIYHREATAGQCVDAIRSFGNRQPKVRL